MDNPRYVSLQHHTNRGGEDMLDFFMAVVELIVDISGVDF